MKKILLVSGCSFTTNIYESAHHPDLVADWPKWPELLAKKLDMSCLNVGKSGAGLEYIYTSIAKNINAKNKLCKVLILNHYLIFKSKK